MADVSRALIETFQARGGALLIFAFFMLSDPKTTPASMAGCLLYGTWVALLGWTLQYLLFIPSAFLYALILSSPLTLAINQYLPGKAFVWPGTGSRA